MESNGEVDDDKPVLRDDAVALGREAAKLTTAEERCAWMIEKADAYVSKKPIAEASDLLTHEGEWMKLTTMAYLLDEISPCDIYLLAGDPVPNGLAVGDRTKPIAEMLTGEEHLLGLQVLTDTALSALDLMLLVGKVRTLKPPKVKEAEKPKKTTEDQFPFGSTGDCIEKRSQRVFGTWQNPFRFCSDTVEFAFAELFVDLPGTYHNPQKIVDLGADEKACPLPSIMPLVLKKLSGCSVPEGKAKRQVSWQRLFTFAKCFGVSAEVLKGHDWDVSKKFAEDGEFPEEGLLRESPQELPQESGGGRKAGNKPKRNKPKPSILATVACLGMDAVSNHKNAEEGFAFLRNLTCYNFGGPKNKNLNTIFHMMAAVLLGTLDDPVSFLASVF